MIVLKLILKLIILPFFLLTVLCEWAGTFFTGIASVILGLLSGICWIVALFSYVTGQCTGRECLELLAIAFVAFIIPRICECFIGGLAGLEHAFRRFLRS